MMTFTSGHLSVVCQHFQRTFHMQNKYHIVVSVLRGAIRTLWSLFIFCLVAVTSKSENKKGFSKSEKAQITGLPG